MPKGKVLTPEERAEIRRLWSEGCRRYEIADRYGVCTETITRITKGGQDAYHKPGKISATIPCEGCGNETTERKAENVSKSSIEEPKPTTILVSESIFNIVGVKTGVTYGINSNADKIKVDGEFISAEIEIDTLAELAKELIDVFKMAKRIKTNKQLVL